MRALLNWLKGKKTYILGTICTLIGFHFQNSEMIMLGLISMGLRSAINNGPTTPTGQ